MYENQIVGVNSRPGDLKVNICRLKQLNNIRAAGKDETVNVVPPMQLTLEDAVEYVMDGEYVEVTPGEIRMGKFSHK